MVAPWLYLTCVCMACLIVRIPAFRPLDCTRSLLPRGVFCCSKTFFRCCASVRQDRTRGAGPFLWCSAKGSVTVMPGFSYCGAKGADRILPWFVWCDANGFARVLPGFSDVVRRVPPGLCRVLWRVANGSARIEPWLQNSFAALFSDA